MVKGISFLGPNEKFQVRILVGALYKSHFPWYNHCMTQRTEHVKVRAVERYHRDLNRADRRTIAALIRDGKGVFLRNHRRADGTGSDNCDDYAVEFKHQWLAVLYDFRRCEVASILPPFVIGRHWTKIQESQKPRIKPRMTEDEMANLLLKHQMVRRPRLGL